MAQRLAILGKPDHRLPLKGQWQEGLMRTWRGLRVEAVCFHGGVSNQWLPGKEGAVRVSGRVSSYLTLQSPVHLLAEPLW